MEANLMAQSGVASVTPQNNTIRRPPSADTASASAPMRVEPTAQTPGSAPNVVAPTVNIPASVDILNAHPTINQVSAEELTFDIPMPFGESEVSESVIDRYVQTVNHALEPSFFRLNVGVHEATNRITVQVVDTNTDEIVREVPPESRLDVIARMQEFVGLLFDGKG